MRSISIAALIAALTVSTFALGAGVSTNVGGTANSATSAAAGNGSTNATTAASGDLNAAASASAGGLGAAASASTSVDASGSVSGGVSEPSSLPSGTSSISSSLLAGGSSLDPSMACEQANATGVSLGAIDAAALAAVTSVAVFSVGDCAGLPAGTLEPGASAALAGNAKVSEALKASGYSGQILGYRLEGTSLTVYVKP